MANISGTPNPDILTGTALSDLIEGLASDDVLYGFDSNDTLMGGSGDDILYGGSGDDTMDGGAGEDLFYGQSGLDTVSYSLALTGLVLNLNFPAQNSGDAQGDSFLSVERFILTNFDDTLYGSGAADDVFGRGGVDLMYGGGGADTLNGDSGNDVLVGGAEGDVLIGGAGFDFASYFTSAMAMTLDLVDPSNTTGDAVGDQYQSIEGLALSDYADRLHLNGVLRLAYGDDGNDSMTGWTTADTLYGGANNDHLTGGAGDDLLEGGDGSDSLFGGAGADRFFGGNANDDAVVYVSTVTLNMANTALGRGEAKGDTFDGVETLVFLGSASTYVGGAADIAVWMTSTTMTCRAGSGAEWFEAFVGAMTVSYQAAAEGVTLSGPAGILTGSRAAAGDTLVNVTSLTLSGFGDVLDMASGDLASLTTVLAGKGNDRLTLNMTTADLIDGGSGKDRVTGQLSVGQINGGTGDDTIDLTSPVQGIGGEATVFGGEGHDVISLGSFFDNLVDGGEGNDSITLSSGAGLERFTVTGGKGDDTILGLGSATAAGSQFDIDGGDGNDTIAVTVLNNLGSVVSLLGGAGDDDIRFEMVATLGNPGLGIVNGGLGDDVLTAIGTDGNDIQTTFVFDALWGDDTVSGFLDGTDLIEFHATGAATFGDLTVTGDATQTMVKFGTDTVLLEGLNIASFTAADVLFT